MKKLTALILFAVMASASQAGLEVQSTWADSDGYFTMSLVDSESGEVLKASRFQLHPDTDMFTFIMDVGDEMPTGEIQTHVDHSSDGLNLPDVTDASDTSDDGSSDATDLPVEEEVEISSDTTNLSAEEAEVGMWGSVRNSLDSIREKLKDSLAKLEGIYESRQDIPAEILEVREEVYEDTVEEDISESIQDISTVTLEVQEVFEHTVEEVEDPKN